MAASIPFRTCSENTMCKFYLEIKSGSYSTAALNHMDENRHEKLQCTYGKECNSFARLSTNSYEKEDIGHCIIYFHNRQHRGHNIEENLGSKKFISGYQKWTSTQTLDIRVSTSLGNQGDLVSELNKNGFADVMLVRGERYRSLYDVANEKLKHPRHAKIGCPLSQDQMLAIILYTDTAVYSDLRSDEMRFCRQKPIDYFSRWQPQKWPIFGAILDSAIRLLDKHDDPNNRPAEVYHGLNNFQIDKSLFNNHGSEKKENHFKYGTFVSTSWDKLVSLGFIGEQGCLLIIDTTQTSYIHQRLVGADVSWISKFSQESEFLIARKPTFEITGIEFDYELNCQVVKVANGHNLYSNSD